MSWPQVDIEIRQLPDGTFQVWDVSQGALRAEKLGELSSHEAYRFMLCGRECLLDYLECQVDKWKAARMCNGRCFA